MKKKTIIFLIYLVFLAAMIGLHMIGISNEITKCMWIIIGASVITVVIGKFVEWLEKR